MAPVKEPTAEISLTDISEDVGRILNKNEVHLFTNVHHFTAETGKDRRAEVDFIVFKEGSTPQLYNDRQRHPDIFSQLPRLIDNKSEQAVLFIIEDINSVLIKCFLEALEPSGNRLSFLRCLDDFLNDQPGYNYEDAQRKIALPLSILAKQSHNSFCYHSVREFEEPFDLTYSMVQTAATRRESEAWRDKRGYGPMNPFPRVDANGQKTRFPPAAVARMRTAVWFDGKPDRPWRTGVILVDRVAKLSGLNGLPKLKPSYHMVAGYEYRDFDSTRTLLSRCMQNNANLKTPGIPAPFVVLEDLYRLMCFEWMRMDSYFKRDLNFIEWVLQRGSGHVSDRIHHKPDTYKLALGNLFHMRRRLNRYRLLIQEQLASCCDAGKPNWKASLGMEKQKIADQVAADLADDFVYAGALMSDSFDRLEQNIRHIAGETALRETEQTNQQNRILLVLTIAGTFFLPISAIAAVLNMVGDWAPDKANFGLFWAICISISVMLMLMLVMIINRDPITRWFHQKRHKGKDGNENIV